MKRTILPLLVAALGSVVSPPPVGAEPRPGLEGEGPARSLRLFPRDPGPPPSSSSSPSSPSAQPAPFGQPPSSPSSTSPPGTAPGEAVSPPSAGRMPSAAPAGAPTGGPPDSEGTRRLAVAPRFAYRLGDAGSAIGPRAGFGFGGTFELTYLRAGPRFDGAVGIDFGYDHFATSEQGMVMVDGAVESFGSTRLISETSFVLVHTVAARLGPVRPFLSVGAGVGVGYFESAAIRFRPGSASDGHLLGRLSLGLDVRVTRIWMATIRVDYTAVRGTNPFRSDDGQTRPVFGDLLGAGLGIAYRF